MTKTTNQAILQAYNKLIAELKDNLQKIENLRESLKIDMFAEKLANYGLAYGDVLYIPFDYYDNGAHNRRIEIQGHLWEICWDYSSIPGVLYVVPHGAGYADCISVSFSDAVHFKNIRLNKEQNNDND